MYENIQNQGKIYAKSRENMYENMQNQGRQVKRHANKETERSREGWGARGIHDGAQTTVLEGTWMYKTVSRAAPVGEAGQP